MGVRGGFGKRPHFFRHPSLINFCQAWVLKKCTLERFQETTIGFYHFFLPTSFDLWGSGVWCQPLCKWGWRRRKRSRKWEILAFNPVFTDEGFSLSWWSCFYEPRLSLDFVFNIWQERKTVYSYTEQRTMTWTFSILVKSLVIFLIGWYSFVFLRIKF